MAITKEDLLAWKLLGSKGCGNKYDNYLYVARTFKTFLGDGDASFVGIKSDFSNDHLDEADKGSVISFGALCDMKKELYLREVVLLNPEGDLVRNKYILYAFSDNKKTYHVVRRYTARKTDLMLPSVGEPVPFGENVNGLVLGYPAVPPYSYRFVKLFYKNKNSEILKGYRLFSGNYKITPGGMKEFSHLVVAISVPKKKTPSDSTENDNNLSTISGLFGAEELLIYNYLNASYEWATATIIPVEKGEPDNKKAMFGLRKAGERVKTNITADEAFEEARDGSDSWKNVRFESGKNIFENNATAVKENVNAEFSSGETIMKLLVYVGKSKTISAQIDVEEKLKSNGSFYSIAVDKKIGIGGEKKFVFERRTVTLANGMNYSGWFGVIDNSIELDDLANEIRDKIIEKGKEVEVIGGRYIKVQDKFANDYNNLREASIKKSIEDSLNKNGINLPRLRKSVRNVVRSFEAFAKRLYKKTGKMYFSDTQLEDSKKIFPALDMLVMADYLTGNTIVTDSFFERINTINDSTTATEIDGIISGGIKSVLMDIYGTANNGKFSERDKKEKINDAEINLGDRLMTYYELGNGTISSKNKVLNHGALEVYKTTEYREFIYEFECKARRKLKITSTSNENYVFRHNKKIFFDTNSLNTPLRIATILPTTEPLQELEEPQHDKLNISKVEEFIQSWMVRKEKTKKDERTRYVPIEGYYDMLSGMTPWVNVGFRKGWKSIYRNENGDYMAVGEEKPLLEKRNGKFYDRNNRQVNGNGIAAAIAGSDFTYLNSINNSYIKSMNITDNGVKKLTLVLIDHDFSSFTLYKDNVFSLESLIRGAIENPFFSSDNVADSGDTYNKAEDNSEGLSNKYLSVSEGFTKISPVNLKVQFGYADYDTEATDGVSETEKRTRGEALKRRFGENNGALRTGRWFTVKEEGTNGIGKISEIRKYIKGGKVEGSGSSGWNDVSKVMLVADSESVSNSNGINISSDAFFNSPFQTANRSREYGFMITGFKSSLSEDGIEYTIEAIEAKDATTMKTRFLQRYSEITANPEELLYNLMHMFNEDNEGNNVDGSKLKICLLEDEDDPYMPDMLNMEYDFRKIGEENMDGTEEGDLYSMATLGKGVQFNEKYLKEITINLGGEEAYRNYNRDIGNHDMPPLYKSVAQLMDEFCALCPPKKMRKLPETPTDENGNELITDQGNYVSVPLKWFTFRDDNEDITYLCLYYRRPQKVNKIRVYTWGPHNPVASCVKNVRIENANEFAVLSGVRAFKTGENSVKPRFETMTKDGSSEYNGNNDRGSSVDIAGPGADAYISAFSSAMYRGSMTILGDPSLNFDGAMQPYTFPIELDVVLPHTDFARRAVNDVRYKEAIDKIKEGRMPRLATSSGKLAWYNRKDGSVAQGNLADEGPEIMTGPSNQFLHEMSGIYVVSKITHNIDSTNYSTTLEIVSYPNISDDVVIK